MKQSQESKFAVYFNTTEKHVMIHKIHYSHIEKHGGVHIHDQGGWEYFITEFEADAFAESTYKTKKFPKPRHCSRYY